ncbi:type IV pili methyl-accepting chemotaxis transducer N-terminal domain-containing protein [Erwinia phyllosphaerae]|uniref:type IV pili methyl-accepting chemotaxis transducer N-terminal domain-containing protein n=1 Tax=Erwinia phyllosphaerae TaxID=2853256 RepID=UPI001FF0554B|nr:type IV pili methyl-accepting chemotaxis transducer N-terminal domain-containing protein [Erwinia phyllosphaerae]MBV4368012.1 type IV pili methyl-accepting chemotaxis transducer N-terminal domain-containing protein [Erwinia phyllosphaerae]
MLKRSVTRSLSRALFAIVLLAFFCSLLALLTLSASLRDAEALNMAGSLRMQSYRLALDTATRSPALAADIASYQQSVQAPVLLSLRHAWVPASVKERYQALLAAWQALRPRLETGNGQLYQQNISHYVAQIDSFVLALQHWAELKMKLVVAACLLGFIAIALLARAFARMSGALDRQYLWLEETIKEKTSDLRQANRRLALLYQCSEMLRNHDKAWAPVLGLLVEHENLTAIELSSSRLVQAAGKADENLPWYSLPLEETEGGLLRWQARASEPQLMQGLATMLARSLQLEHAEQKVRHLLLMEERATIARELHDSLAQSLVYLRIQMARLKRAVVKEPSALAIVAETDVALSEANRQLRELLTTFRLSVAPADLTTALGQVIAQLRPQTEATISLTGKATRQHLDAQQQVHVLQIVREALLNAIRHAKASEITVQIGQPDSEEIQIEVKDNGLGFDPEAAKPGHYGLTIMQERAKSLQGRLEISHPHGGGSQVSLRFALKKA